MNNPICQLILSHKKQKIKNKKKSTHTIPTPKKTTLTLPPNNSVRFNITNAILLEWDPCETRNQKGPQSL